jgi:hypothetical protein
MWIYLYIYIVTNMLVMNYIQCAVLSVCAGNYNSYIVKVYYSHCMNRNISYLTYLIIINCLLL